MIYICLLRGVNVSGKNKVSMSNLKTELENNGYRNVCTYLNSGNVIFESHVTDNDKLCEDIKQIIFNKFQLNIPVFVLNYSELTDLLDNRPNWLDLTDKNIYNNIIFLIRPTITKDVYDSLGKPTDAIEKIMEYNNFIYWSFDLKNYRKANWWIKTASTNIKDKITIRTVNTISKLLELYKKIK